MLAIILITLVLLEAVLRAGFVLLPPPLQLHLIENLPPSDLPADAGETAWALRAFPSRLAVSRAVSVDYQPALQNDLYILTCAKPPPDLDDGFNVRFDPFGFRLDQTYPLTANNPDVIVIGDSFGASYVMASPFWQGVSDRVWGLSVDGAGIVEQANILRAMLTTRAVTPDVIVVPLFEGNDLAEDHNYPFAAERYEPPTRPTASSPFARLYTVQVATYMSQRGDADAPLPPNADRLFDMSVDNIPPSETPVLVRAGMPIRGWALDSRGGGTADTGIARVRLHAGPTCAAPLVAVDDQTSRERDTRQDVAEAFDLPADSAYIYSGFWIPLDVELGVQSVTFCAESRTGELVSQGRLVDVQPCPLPTTTRDGQEIVFYPPYLAWMTLSADDIRASTSYANTGAALLDIQAMADEVGAQMLILYLPTKVHTYINALDDAALLAYNEQLQAYAPTSDNPFGDFGPIPDLTPADVVARLRNNIGDQRDVMAAFAAANDIPFVDATPALQAAVADGQMPFHAGDTHTNDLGADIIREVLRAALVPYLNEQ